MKTIDFREFTYVLNIYRGTVEISNEDYNLLEKEEITMHDIMNKYELDYNGYSDPCYEDSKFDDIEWV